MNLRRIALSHLIASGQPRPLLTAAVDKIAASIKEIGLIQPITITETSVLHGTVEPGWKIVAGHHRVAACRSLGWTEIDAFVIDDVSHLQTELIEIDENLCRAELSQAQRTKYTKRRAQIWEALHPDDAKRQRDADLTDESNTTQVSGLDDAEKESGAACATLPKPKTGRGNIQFAAATAAATGQSKATTNRALANANALGIDTLNKLANTSLDSGVELDALAKLPPEQRTGLVERAAAGERVSARLVAAPDAQGDELMQAMKFKADFARITKEIDADNPRLAADLPWADVIRHMGWLLQDIQKRKRWPAIHPKTKTEIGLIWAELEAFFLTHLKG